MKNKPTLPRYITILLSLSVVLNLPAQDAPAFTAMFYNVENLFDIYDDSTKNDNDFLPDSKKHWNKYRYNDKIAKTAKTIIAAGKFTPPSVVGLAEVENANCLDDLVKNSPLLSMKYKYVHFESPDARGIDVALLYRDDCFVPLKQVAFPIHFPENEHLKTRDILYVKGYSVSLKDTLHIFVNHWPSRWGGAEKSEFKRVYAASVLREKVDSVMNLSSDANIFIMGDFNDYPENKSISVTLNAHQDTSCNTCLHLLRQDNFPGTHKYKGRWNSLDHVIVSRAMYSRYNLQSRIVNEPFLLEEDGSKGGYIPFRTYKGFVYAGGFSDHLPLVTEILQKQGLK